MARSDPRVAILIISAKCHRHGERLPTTCSWPTGTSVRNNLQKHADSSVIRCRQAAIRRAHCPRAEPGRVLRRVAKPRTESSEPTRWTTTWRDSFARCERLFRPLFRPDPHDGSVGSGGRSSGCCEGRGKLFDSILRPPRSMASAGVRRRPTGPHGPRWTKSVKSSLE